MIKKRDLENLKYYISEKEHLIREIDIYCSSLSDGYRSIDFSEPKSKNQNNDAMIKLIFRNSRIQSEIGKRVKKIESIILKLMKIINKIKDPQIRCIVELRAVYGKTWEQIGEEVHMDGSYVRKKYYKFIDE